MKISYNWLSKYLNETIEPERLSLILTSIGLEVESVERFETVKGGLAGVVIGEVLTVEQHPNADKLKITSVNTGGEQPLQIVCGAANVAAGQKVVVATVGTTIYPYSGEPLTMKVAKIRGVESFGMICAEDELGLGASHAGIMVLPSDTPVGIPAATYFEPYEDWVYEIGLTPNRMDAMSHLGVAKDVTAYLSHHEGKSSVVKTPLNNEPLDWKPLLLTRITIVNTKDCWRYAGVSIAGVTVKESPQWLKNALTAIGQRPINNIVDITNYILHETGQPLHAFDVAQIKGNDIWVGNLTEGTPFINLDEKERKLSKDDLIICDSEGNPMCIAGVFGGLHSGVKNTTTDIFIESACFNPAAIRKTSLLHGLRTEAATRFEKGVDISATVTVLKRAAQLIVEIGGGTIASDIQDIYPAPQEKKQVAITYTYIKKLSGKHYTPAAIQNILQALGFEIITSTEEALTIAVPFNKPDISIPADIVEEIVRIDGLDNIEIPATITLTPSLNASAIQETLKDKLANWLVGNGFNEIVTNSITNSEYFTAATDQEGLVKMLNNLSVELNVLRPSLLQTGLETIAYNVNRKNQNLRLFEFGNTYQQIAVGNYTQKAHLGIYITGNNQEDNWNQKAQPLDFYYAKGIVAGIFELLAIPNLQFSIAENATQLQLNIAIGNNNIGSIEAVSTNTLQAFGIKQEVFFIDLWMQPILDWTTNHKVVYKEVSKFPAVQRDIALVVDEAITYKDITAIIDGLKLTKLQSTRLFDVFKSDKLGVGKKSLGINCTFLDEEKTLTDKETDGMMAKLVQQFEKQLGAEIRK